MKKLITLLVGLFLLVGVNNVAMAAGELPTIKDLQANSAQYDNTVQTVGGFVRLVGMSYYNEERDGQFYNAEVTTYQLYPVEDREMEGGTFIYVAILDMNKKGYDSPPPHVDLLPDGLYVEFTGIWTSWVIVPVPGKVLGMPIWALMSRGFDGA